MGAMIIRRLFGAILALSLAGCEGLGGAQAVLGAAGQVKELSETRIGRLTTHNDTKQELCLVIARALSKQAERSIDDGDPETGLSLSQQAMAFMDEDCRPALIIERAKEVLGGAPAPPEPGAGAAN
jgi:hypothetical protein